uniref:Uncharacterized protein n=1 Tax=Ciona savignyi TaxID=51511 RepID=H2YWU7_CIOSA
MNSVKTEPPTSFMPQNPGITEPGVTPAPNMPQYVTPGMKEMPQLAQHHGMFPQAYLIPNGHASTADYVQAQAQAQAAVAAA